MRYVLIDNDGALQVKDGNWKTDLGPEGPGQVGLGPRDGEVTPTWSGWVNDDGHRLGLPRNLIGGLILNGLGAALRPYAGPVVITGWDVYGMPTEVTDLCEHRIAAIQEIHADARRAMDGAEGNWAEDARAIADEMRTAPTPGITVRPLDDFADLEDILRLMRGGS